MGTKLKRIGGVYRALRWIYDLAGVPGDAETWRAVLLVSGRIVKWIVPPLFAVLWGVACE